MVAGRDEDFGGALGTLQKQEQALSQQLEEIQERYQQETAELTEKLERVRAGIAGLTGENGRGRKGKPGRKGGGEGLTADGAVSIIEEILSKEGPQSELDLKKAVGDRAAALGKKRQGSHFALKKALKDESFKKVGDRWELAKS